MSGATRDGELTLADGTTVSLRGHLGLVEAGQGLRPTRLPVESRVRFPPDWAPLLMTVSQASGVRLAVRTAARRARLHVRCARTQVEDSPGPINSFVIEVDGQLIGTVEAPVDAICRVSGATLATDELRSRSVVEIGPLPDGDKELVIWFPQAMVVDLIGLEADAPVRPAPIHLPRWVHYGSSISQCATIEDPTDAWPVVAARLAGLEVVNLGFGGQCLLDPFVADAIAAAEADVISLKLGVNVVGARAMNERTFAPAVHGFLDRIRAGHPRTPIVVSSSILWPGSEDRPGPSDVEFFPDGGARCFTRGDVRDVAEGALTMRSSRAHLQLVVDARAAAGEPIHYLDGLALYGPDDAARRPLPDSLHPDEAAYRLIGERFASAVFGAGGLVPAHALTRAPVPATARP